jgi:predicted metal-dependent HD superfamily phosphohydrolase
MTLFEGSWQRAWSGIGARGDGVSVRDELLRRYGEPHRRYHSLQHLDECLVAFDSAAALALHPAEVELALWFHDAIYEVRHGDNERRSADWARDALADAGVPVDAAGRVHALVMVTCHQAAPQDGDAQLLVDIDLSILGAEAARFAEYEAQIRDEYAFIPAWLFRRKRRAILRSFIERPRIYSTATFHDALEARARSNLARAIAATR